MSSQAILLSLIPFHLLLFIHPLLCLSHSLAWLANANPSPLRGPVVVDAYPSPLRMWMPLPLPWAASRCLSLSPIGGGSNCLWQGGPMTRRYGKVFISTLPFLSSPARCRRRHAVAGARSASP
ncbi:hypothetical protein DAI22_08g125900 [Oryza sativa Japonica Group]|nr:hypothetical protein DAI22_08g125900 [Oryza sativa Japonica Group]